MSTPNDMEHWQELAALHALGALEGEDLRQFQQVLADRDPALLREVAAAADTAALLARALPPAPAPSPGVKDRLMASLQNRPPSRPAASASPSSPIPPGLAFVLANDKEGWMSLPVPGAYVKPLSMSESTGYVVALGRLEPGASYPAHAHIHAEEVYLLSGDLHVSGRTLRAGDFHHAEPGSEHGVNFSESGCTILVILSKADLAAQFAPA